MSDMTNNDARALERFAARLLVAVDERDWTVIQDSWKDLSTDDLAMLTKLGAMSIPGSEIIKAEVDDENFTMYSKFEGGYQFSKTTHEYTEDGKYHIKGEAWVSEEDMEDEIVW